MRQCQHGTTHRMLAVVRRRIECDFGAVAVAHASSAQLLGGRVVERTVHTYAVIAAFAAIMARDTHMRMHFRRTPAPERGTSRTSRRRQIDDEQQQRYVLSASHTSERSHVMMRTYRLQNYKNFPIPAIFSTNCRNTEPAGESRTGRGRNVLDSSARQKNRTFSIS